MMRKNIRGTLIQSAAVIMLALFAMLGGGCNTIEGVGEDMSAAGQTMADWANDDDDGQ